MRGLTTPGARKPSLTVMENVKIVEIYGLTKRYGSGALVSRLHRHDRAPWRGLRLPRPERGR